MSGNQQQPNAPKPPLVFDPFAGLNTQATRPSIEDNQASWLDGWMPIGKGNHRTIPGVGTKLFTAAANTTVVFFWFGNIGSVPYLVTFTSDGAIWITYTTTQVPYRIAPPGTILNPSLDGVGICQWGAAYFIIVANQTNGYWIWDGTTFYSSGMSLPGFSPGTMPTGVQGTSVETFQGRVWITKGPNVLFSAPGNPTDFATADGGGSFASSDSFLRVAYTRLLQTNGFLYLIATDSINYITGVQTAGSPPTTTFTNQNANPEVGTPWPWAVGSVNGNIVLANADGVHLASGSTVQKISPELDGIYNTVPQFGGFEASAAKHILYGKRLWMVLQTVLDKNYAQTVYTPTGVLVSDAATAKMATAGALAGIGASFSRFVFEGWVYLPTLTNGLWFSNQTVDSPWSGTSGLQIGITHNGASAQIIVTGFDVTNTEIFSISFVQSVWTNWMWFGISVDTSIQAITCFVNTGSGDTQLSPFTTFWGSSNPIGNPTAQPWHLAASSVGATFSAADIFFSVPSSYVDLGVTANRRLFITDTGGAVFAPLTTGGVAPFPATPAIFLTVPAGGAATMFPTNFGTGGAFTVSVGTLALTTTNPPSGVNLIPDASDDSAGDAYLDSGIQIAKLFIWDGKRWFTSQQDIGMTFIAHQEINSVITAAATDGTGIWYLMQTPSSNFAKVAQSKLYAEPDGYNYLKSANRWWGMAYYNSPLSPILSITLDTDEGHSLFSETFYPSAVIWYNSSLTAVPWTTTTGAVAVWTGNGTGNNLTVFPPTAVNGVGVVIGTSIKTLAADVTLVSSMIEVSTVGYRG